MIFQEELRQYVEDSTKISTYIQNMPDVYDDCIVINQYGSNFSDNGYGINYGFVNRQIQITARGIDYKSSYEFSHEVFTLLDSGYEEEICVGNFKVISRPKQLPFFITKDEKGRIYTTCNYTMIVV